MRIGLVQWQHEAATCIGPRYLTMMVGRGGGKTNTIAARIRYLCTRFPKFVYLYVSPVSDLGDEVFDEITGNTAFMRQYVRSADKRKYPEIIFKNKSRAKFRSMQRPRGLRGKNINEVSLDEIQDPIYTKEHFEKIINPMVRGLSPAGNFGTIVFSGQFKSGEDWVKEKFYNYGSKFLDDGKQVNPLYQPARYRSWRIPASEGFIYQGEKGKADYELRKAEIIGGGGQAVWDQEYECIPTASQYAAFPADQLDEISKYCDFQIGSNFTRRLQIEQQPRAGERYCVVADPGRKPDPTGIVIGDSRGNVVFEDVYSIGQPHKVSARNAALLAIKYNRALLVCAANEFVQHGKTDDAYVHDYKQQADAFHLDFKAVYEGGNEKNRMVDNLNLALQAKKFTIPTQCGKLITQLKEYEYVEKKKSGLKRLQYEGSGAHDDLVSCMYIYVEAVITREWIRPGNGGNISRLMS